MMRIIDQTNDPGFGTLRVIAERFPKVREMAKTANLDPAEFEGLPSSAFAWPGRRLFPIHNKEQAIVSMGYSKLARVLPSDVQDMLDKAATAYDIDPTIFEAPIEIQKVAEVDEQYLLPEKKRFRVASAEDVPIAERVYREKYAQLSIEDRAEAGFHLKKVAQHFEVCLHPSTEKLAGFTIMSTRTFKDWVEARREAAIKLGSSLSQAFEQLASEFHNTEPFLINRRDQIKLAQLVSRLDKQAGLTRYYGRSLPDPLQTVFNTEKRAEDFVKIGAALQNKELLQSLPVSFWSDVLGSDIAREIAPEGELDPTLLEQILPTLPADLKVALETQLAAYNS